MTCFQPLTPSALLGPPEPPAAAPARQSSYSVNQHTALLQRQNNRDAKEQTQMPELGLYRRAACEDTGEIGLVAIGFCSSGEAKRRICPGRAGEKPHVTRHTSTLKSKRTQVQPERVCNLEGRGQGAGVRPVRNDGENGLGGGNGEKDCCCCCCCCCCLCSRNC